MSTTTTTLAYRIGDPDAECRYPVIIGTENPLVIGWAFRWHRNWLVTAAWTDGSESERNLHRPAKGDKGVDMAAAFLAEQYAAGAITAVPLAEALAEMPLPIGPVLLLHPRMAVKERNDRNIASALKAFAGLAEHHWRAYGGFPGSDNPWFVGCELCGWTGPKYWSHLRGRNGNPPSITRHLGKCVDEDKIREAIPAYRQQ
ncbi:hypothetical protein [Streptomyces sp. NRRL S-350]|uniref:hypothetical protein n=1 Tax=Streptomyces sp. NRRL S-350 TaxID=1463902 RepID=UPI00068DFF0C|nr:hypothetical protein [Streptomyces sp. NRRL S-350]